MKSGSCTTVVPFFRSNFCSSIVSGSLELTASVPLDDIFEEDGRFQPDPLKYGDGSSSSILCLLITPAMLIPCDLLRLFSSHKDTIKSIEILQHSNAHGKYLSLIYTTDENAASAIRERFHGKSFTSLDPTVALIYGVKNISITEDVTGDDEASTNIVNEAFGGEVEIEPLASVAGRIDEDIICVLCLEMLAAGNTFTMCCSHVFHIDCVMRLENPQCPVCRYQHEDISETMSCCNECGWKGDEREKMNSSTEKIITETVTLDTNNFDKDPGNIGADNDLWLCLVCGFIGCGKRHLGHIHRHYQEHMHTYVMNTESRRVYDFAGGGYVHRLLLQEADIGAAGFETSKASGNVNRSIARNKVVEIADPRSLTGFGLRPATADMSSEQEEMLVHRKLEEVAAQYNNILTIQLARQRQMYETQLRLLDDKIMEGTNISTSAEIDPAELERRPLSHLSNGEWAEKVISSLQAERRKLLQQCDNIQSRLTKSEKEKSILDALNESLIKNKVEWQQMVSDAEAELSRAEFVLRAELPPLERKVRELMLRLEQASKGAESKEPR